MSDDPVFRKSDTYREIDEVSDVLDPVIFAYRPDQGAVTHVQGNAINTTFSPDVPFDPITVFVGNTYSGEGMFISLSATTARSIGESLLRVAGWAESGGPPQ